MYYKLRQDVLFRQYDEYGLITDNSEYGYRMLNDMKRPRGEKYVSNSGAIMLATLLLMLLNGDITIILLLRLNQLFLHHMIIQRIICLIG